MQSDVNQDNFVPIDNYSQCKEFKHVIDPKFDDREFVNDKENTLSCEDKGVILEEHKLEEDVISLSCSI